MELGHTFVKVVAFDLPAILTIIVTVAVLVPRLSLLNPLGDRLSPSGCGCLGSGFSGGGVGLKRFLFELQLFELQLFLTLFGVMSFFAADKTGVGVVPSLPLQILFLISIECDLAVTAPSDLSNGVLSHHFFGPHIFFFVVPAPDGLDHSDRSVNFGPGGSSSTEMISNSFWEVFCPADIEAVVFQGQDVDHIGHT